MASEVARFRQQQQDEEEAAQLALSGLAAMASHNTIIQRMQQGSGILIRLFEAGQDEEAFKLWEGGILE